MLVLSGGGLCPDIRGRVHKGTLENMCHDIGFVLLQHCPEMNASNGDRKILCQDAVENLILA